MQSQFKGVLVAMVGLAVILPVLVTATLNPSALRFVTQADTSAPLRIWVEPSSLVVEQDEEVTVSVMAEYENGQTTLPGVRLLVRGDGGVVISQPGLEYLDTFRGRTKLGEVSFKVTEPGEKKLWIDDNSVNTGLPDLSVVSTGAQISID